MIHIRLLVQRASAPIAAALLVAACASAPGAVPPPSATAAATPAADDLRALERPLVSAAAAARAALDADDLRAAATALDEVSADSASIVAWLVAHPQFAAQDAAAAACLTSSANALASHAPAYVATLRRTALNADQGRAVRAELAEATECIASGG